MLPQGRAGRESFQAREGLRDWSSVLAGSRAASPSDGRRLEESRKGAKARRKAWAQGLRLAGRAVRIWGSRHG